MSLSSDILFVPWLFVAVVVCAALFVHLFSAHELLKKIPHIFVHKRTTAGEQAFLIIFIFPNKYVDILAGLNVSLT